MKRQRVCHLSVTGRNNGEQLANALVSNEVLHDM